MADRELKAEYKRLRAVLQEALNAADLMGLLDSGSPADEYDPEIGTILPRLRGASSVDEVRDVLVEEFAHWFGEAGAGSADWFVVPAQRIWSFLESERALWNAAPDRRRVASPSGPWRGERSGSGEQTDGDEDD